MPFTDSQHGWKGPQWVTLSHLPAQAHGTGLCAHSSGIYPVREIPHPVWASCSRAQSLHRKILPHVQVKFSVHQLLLIPLVPLLVHGAEPGPCSDPSLQTLADRDEGPSQSCLPRDDQARFPHPFLTNPILWVVLFDFFPQWAGDADTGCPEGLWSLHPQRCSKPGQMQLRAASSC